MRAIDESYFSRCKSDFIIVVTSQYTNRGAGRDGNSGVSIVSNLLLVPCRDGKPDFPFFPVFLVFFRFIKWLEN